MLTWQWPHHACLHDTTTYLIGPSDKVQTSGSLRFVCLQPYTMAKGRTSPRYASYLYQIAEITIFRQVSVDHCCLCQLYRRGQPNLNDNELFLSFVVAHCKTPIGYRNGNGIVFMFRIKKVSPSVRLIFK